MNVTKGTYLALLWTPVIILTFQDKAFKLCGWLGTFSLSGDLRGRESKLRKVVKIIIKIPKRIKKLPGA